MSDGPLLLETHRWFKRSMLLVSLLVVLNGALQWLLVGRWLRDLDARVDELERLQRDRKQNAIPLRVDDAGTLTIGGKRVLR